MNNTWGVVVELDSEMQICGSFWEESDLFNEGLDLWIYMASIMYSY